ncbi:TPA: hypothetical protein HA249_05445 [Candidatus Woesearchaeota archaeon]|nr:hypothetical protein [Candidatus Woesearchaeota archaeon]HIH47408.1 hypothetical protein [Candidatus Woesearchaeota archaeon]HII88343.1 hypothetical protein [Candidatus Woesearchaeota archaeon]
MEPQQFLVAIVGPSGVGKSTVIREVVRAGQGTYVHVRAYTTRPSREEEIDRIHMPLEEFAEKARKKKILLPNMVYGHHYGPSREHIDSIASEGYVPIMDWPVRKLADLRKELAPLEVMAIYLLPDSLESLRLHLEQDEKNNHEQRYQAAVQELEEIRTGRYMDVVNTVVVNNRPIEEMGRILHTIIQYHHAGRDHAHR